MKSTILFILVFLSILLIGCSSVSSTVTGDDRLRPEGSISDDKDYYTSLEDYLRHIPGITISSGIITVRGVNNFNGVITPLYVLDGNPIGRSYSVVNNMVDPRSIDYVHVLKGPDATMYGVRGGNGVIQIVTKKI